jgi:hypothetical protein
MIINKTYDFYNIPKEDPFIGIVVTLKDYHRKILTNIMYNCNQFLLKGEIDPIIFTGVEGCSMIQDSAGFSFSNLLNCKTTTYATCIGLLMGKDVYFDLRLEANEVILGSTLYDIEHYIITRKRKEKLKKINGQIH